MRILMLKVWINLQTHVLLNSGMTSGYVSWEHKTSEHTSLQYDKQVVVSHADTPVNATTKCLPPKVLEFYAPNSGGCTSTAVQTTIINLEPTQPYPFSQGSEYVSQPIITPVGLVSDPQSNTASSCHRVHSPQQLTGYSHVSFLVNKTRNGAFRKTEWPNSSSHSFIVETYICQCITVC